MTLEKLHCKALNVMRGYYSRNDELPPTFLALDRDDMLHVMLARSYAEKRDLYEMLLRAYFIVHGVTAYAVAIEAWAAMQPVENTSADERGRLWAKLPASEDPNRFEVLTTLAVGRHGVVGRSYPIIRTPSKRPAIGPELTHLRPPIDAERVGMMGFLERTPGAVRDVNLLRAVLAERIPIYFGITVLNPAQYA